MQTEERFLDFCTDEYLTSSGFETADLDLQGTLLTDEEKNAMRFRDQDIEGKRADLIAGEHGSYDISQGFFFCLTDLDDTKSRDAANKVRD